jgi:hypothetical protein
MEFRPELLDAFSAFGSCPRVWNAGLGWLSIKVEINRRKILEEADEHERHLIIGELTWRQPKAQMSCVTNTNLLPKTDPRAGVERNKYEWVMSKIFLCAVVEEAVRIKFKSC